jgi:hypothetical protein
MGCIMNRARPGVHYKPAADLKETGGRWLTPRDGASVGYHMETSARTSRLCPGDLAIRTSDNGC